MAEVLRYVNTASSGGDGTTNGESGGTAAYASLVSWEAAEQTDLVSDGDTNRIVCSIGSGSVVDTSLCYINGWTTGAGNGITVEAASGEEAGTEWDATKYTLEVNSAWSFLIIQEYTDAFSLQVRNTSGSASVYVFEVRSKYSTVEGCYVHWEHDSPNLTAFKNGLFCGGHDGVFFINNVVVMKTTEVDEILYVYGIHHRSDTGAAYNNTVYVKANSGPTSGAYVIRGAGNIYNNIADVSDSSGDLIGFRYNTFTGDEDYNASTDATPTGPNSRLNQTFSFVSSTDFALAGNDKGALNFGTDLSEDPTYPFSVDILGTTRPLDGTWDIGATEILATAGFFGLHYYYVHLMGGTR